MIELEFFLLWIEDRVDLFIDNIRNWDKEEYIVVELSFVMVGFMVVMIIGNCFN